MYTHIYGASNHYVLMPTAFSSAAVKINPKMQHLVNINIHAAFFKKTLNGAVLYGRACVSCLSRQCDILIRFQLQRELEKYCLSVKRRKYAALTKFHCNYAPQGGRESRGKWLRSCMFNMDYTSISFIASCEYCFKLYPSVSLTVDILNNLMLYAWLRVSCETCTTTY